MEHDRRRTIEELFQEILDLPADRREAVLESRCGEDEDLRREVQGLVAAYEDAGPAFLDGPVFAHVPGGDELPRSVGPYDVLQRIGEGGMGVVYEAEQRQPRRRIAIKVLRPGLYGKAQLSRFRRECDALGRLSHDGIAGVYDAGTAEVAFGSGRAVELPFLAMELVRGRDLLDHVEHAALDRFSRLELFGTVCDAVHYAHSQGVVHRDLKPRNILVDGAGRPKIVDFGVARITADADHTRHTRTGDVLGTPCYMSPEQLFGDRDRVDERSDVYSLGVILYELLSGESPYGCADTSLTDRIRWHERGEVPDLGKHDPTLRGELEAIVRMALATEPEKRYRSAADLAEDVRRHLKGEPILARVDTSWDVARRFLRRHRSAALPVTAALVLVATAVVLAVDPFGWLHPSAVPVDGGDRLAVLYFDNLAEPGDPARRGEIVTELLISALSQSGTLDVVSSQRLYDLLKLMGREGEKKIDRTTATELAARAGARWMLVGDIVQTEPALTVTSQVVDVATGKVVASERAAAGRRESVFSLVDRLTEETRTDLGVPGASHAPVTSVAEISTDSEEAYREYLAGVGYARKQFYQEAREHLGKAVAIDSTFAMAAFRLALVGTGDMGPRYLAQAVRHADRASARERMYLRAAEALLRGDEGGRVAAFEDVLRKYPDDKYALEQLIWFSDPKKAIEYGERLLELDPQDEVAYNALAYAYSRDDQLEDAVRIMHRYIELAPDEPNPWDSLGEIYADHGMLPEAVAAYEKAVEIKPDFADYSATVILGDMYVYQGQYAKAEAEYRRLFTSGESGTREAGRARLIDLMIYRGRIAEALEQIDAAFKVGSLEGSGAVSDRLAVRGELLHEIGEREESFAAVSRAAERADNGREGICYDTARRLAAVGRPEEAERYLSALEHGGGVRDEERYHAVKARVESARGNREAALRDASESAAACPSWAVHLWSRRAIVEACFDLRDWTTLISAAEPLAARYFYDPPGPMSRMRFPLFAARLPYYLGVAYQEVGRTDEAAERLRQFLSIWENADPRLTEPEDARRRLASIERDG